MVKGAGNTTMTPEIVLSMMKECIIPPQDVEPHSYVAIADGHKRHNMAKVFAGFYDYDDATTERSKQRRRWINSTVHNLAELLFVRDLCGTFCFSMQLAGTPVLPAAIAFTLYLIIISIIPGGANTTIPLVLLAIVLGLPGLLIVITSRKVAYVGWMLVYLVSLPVWNGLLPAYAFWHFDDFSWGRVKGSKGDSTGDKEGEFDSTIADGRVELNLGTLPCLTRCVFGFSF
jgi:Chitin synthase